MAEKYKYNLNHLLSLTPRGKSIESIVAELEKEGITERTFYRDRSILHNEASDIPAERLMKYAKFFNVDIEELFNYDTNVKPLTERKLSEFDKKLIDKTGLKK